MQINATHPLFPIASLVAGVFLLIAPRVVTSDAGVRNFLRNENAAEPMQYIHVQAHAQRKWFPRMVLHRPDPLHRS